MPDEKGHKRDSKGLFAPGNKGGPGNPHAGKVQEYRAALRDVVNVDEFRKVAHAMMIAAQNGDVAAGKLIFERILGKDTDVDGQSMSYIKVLGPDAPIENLLKP